MKIIAQVHHYLELSSCLWKHRQSKAPSCVCWGQVGDRVGGVGSSSDGDNRLVPRKRAPPLQQGQLATDLLVMTHHSTE